MQLRWGAQRATGSSPRVAFHSLLPPRRLSTRGRATGTAAWARTRTSTPPTPGTMSPRARCGCQGSRLWQGAATCVAACTSGAARRMAGGACCDKGSLSPTMRRGNAPTVLLAHAGSRRLPCLP